MSCVILAMAGAAIVLEHGKVLQIASATSQLRHSSLIRTCGSARMDQVLEAVLPFADTPPSWDDLRMRTLRTTTGERLHAEVKERAAGRGPPHIDANVRLFDARNAADVRVTLFRDAAGWCPFCQTLWLLLEEKRIPFRVCKINLNAYGHKPAWYLRRVDNGSLPAIELDGEMYVESLDLLRLIDDRFPHHGPRMHPPPAADTERVAALLPFGQELTRDWLSLTFKPVNGEALRHARRRLLATLARLDAAFGLTSGPWALGTASPSALDLHYISRVERIVASVLFWRGVRIRDGRFPNLDRWLSAFEERRAYIASKSDYYTLVSALPTQHGPAHSIPEAREPAAAICGMDGSWRLHEAYREGSITRNGLAHTAKPLEPLAPLQAEGGEQAARHEAAFALVANHAAVARFAARGVAPPGRPAVPAPLADPNADLDVPNGMGVSAASLVGPVDVCLRYVVVALLDGVDAAVPVSFAKAGLMTHGGRDDCLSPRPAPLRASEADSGASGRRQAPAELSTLYPCTRGDDLSTCLVYLRDRVGVPRDMGQAAAMQLRAHLNWAIALRGSRSFDGL